jgi:protoporphyrinogen oxidase
VPNSPLKHKRAIIIGAGPAGLTTAYELLTRTDIQPIILEKGDYIGGISRTVNYQGNRMDIGGHRFFSKSDRVMDWWLKILPLEVKKQEAVESEHASNLSDSDKAATPENRVMLLRPRKSRIYYLRRFFDYPIHLSKDTLMKLGLVRTFQIGASYLKSALFQLKPEQTLEQFFINRFGKKLYLTFFKSYTEKVWGVPCNQISAEWGAQRIKGLSVWSTLIHAAKKLFEKNKKDITQKNTETSLIEQFLYPKLGPGQMWEEVARQVTEMGGRLHTSYQVVGLRTNGWSVQAVEAVNLTTGDTEVFEGDYFFSTAPVKELMRSFDVPPPADILKISDGLMYRDFITVGLLVSSLKIYDHTPQGKKLISDNWIYIQEPDVLLGRLQVFNNWSPYMAADPNRVWLGLEYFCNETDDLWTMSNEKMAELAKKELEHIGIIDTGEVLDATVIHVEKTYPAYFGTYNQFPEIRSYVDRYTNLFLLGRNGMHRYNNQDHSMLTAMVAVDNIAAEQIDKSNIWNVNTETEYHEETRSSQ